MLTFTKTKNTGFPVSVHNAGVTLQSRDIPHTLPSPIFYERALDGKCQICLSTLSKLTTGNAFRLQWYQNHSNFH
jgi:hypothetical protein